jgi:hypothetical protein
MKDTRHWQPVVRQLFHSRPRRLVFLAPSPKRFVPERDDAVAKGAYGRPVCRDGMIREKAGDDLSQPVSLLWDWLMSLAQQRFLDFLEFRAHAVASGFPLEEEPAPARFPANQREAKKSESHRSSQTSPSAIDRRVATELDQAGLFRMQRQRELPQPFAHLVPEAPSVGLALKADDDVVG